MNLGTLQSSRVLINVYDLNESNEYLYGVGLGLYHSGVQVGGLEWTFASQAGIFSTEPKYAPGARFRESIDMGVFDGSSREVDLILDELRKEFRGSDYNILTKNCNAFASAFVHKLVNRHPPAYINRMAEIGACFSCLLPPSLTNHAPVDWGTGGGGGGGGGGSVYRIGGSSSSGSSSFNAFGGQGYKLGATTNGEMQSMEISSSTTPSTLNDRREKLRQAAMSRLS